MPSRSIYSSTAPQTSSQISPALERTTHCFYRWVARKMLEANGTESAA